MTSPQGESLQARVKAAAQVKFDGLKIELAGLNLGEIQNVIDDGQQRLGGCPDHVEVFTLFLGKVGVEGQLRHTQDSVHRGTYFMAHIGHKLALGPVRSLGANFRLFQFCCPLLDTQFQPPARTKQECHPAQDAQHKCSHKPED